MAKPTVLFVDNDPFFLDTRTEFLERADYNVLKAYTLKQARQLFLEACVHVAVVDIRMENDDDPKDASGLTLLRDPALRSVPKIVLTNFKEVEYTLKTLRPTSDGPPLAVNYLAKEEGPDALIRAIEVALSRHVRINWQLQIRWGWAGGPQQATNLVSLIMPELPQEWLVARASELEDTLRKLFFQYQQLTLGNVLARREGVVLLTALAYTEQDREESFILVCGQRDKLQEHRRNYDTFVSGNIGPRAIALANHVETMHFGAATCRLLGCTSIEDVLPLTQFYRERSLEPIVAAIRDLLQISLRPWHAEGTERRNVPVKELYLEWMGDESSNYLLTHSEWETHLNSICQQALRAGIGGLQYAHRSLMFQSPEGKRFLYPDPISCLLEVLSDAGQSMLYGVTHGRLGGETVFVDQAGQTWLLDFGSMGIAPLVKDFVSLEVSVKLGLLREADLSLRHDMEMRLVAQRHLSELVDTENTTLEVAKALAVIHEIRSHAARVLGPDMYTYLLGLLLQTLEWLLDYQPRLRYTRREMLRFAHALLSSSMACQQLMVPSGQLEQLPRQATNSLWLGEDKQEVWVRGRPVILSPQEFQLLKYLYDRANQLCERSSIAESVFSFNLSDLYPTQAKQVMRDSINSAIRRLRKKIEPDPAHPEYIRTVRGVGYRLVLDNLPPDHIA